MRKGQHYYRRPSTGLCGTCGMPVSLVQIQWEGPPRKDGNGNTMIWERVYTHDWNGCINSEVCPGAHVPPKVGAA